MPPGKTSTPKVIRPVSNNVPTTPPEISTPPAVLGDQDANMETDAVSPERVFNSAGRRCRKELVQQFNAAKNPLAPPFSRPFTADEMLNGSGPMPYEEDELDDLGLDEMFNENPA